MQGEDEISNFLDGETGGSTPQLSPQNQQASLWPSQQPTVSPSQEETHESEDTDNTSDSMSDYSLYDADDREKDEDMVMSPRKICNDIEKMEKKIGKMNRQILYMGEEVENNGVLLHKVMELCRKTNESMENIQNQLQKQQNSRTENATGRKRSKEKQEVDPLCRDTFRKSYKSLKKEENFQGFDFKRSLAENEEVLKKVKDKMSDNNGSCKWTDEQIKNVARRYFLSLSETDKKKSDNKYDDHKTNSRRQNRKKQKLKRRTETLNNIDWVRSEKEKATEVLTEEYMSSEVSESGIGSPSGDEGCSKEKKLYIKTVPWESKDLKTLKSKLDKEYTSRQTSHCRRREFQRERRPKDVSSRPKPNNCPSWAFREDDGQ